MEAHTSSSSKQSTFDCSFSPLAHHLFPDNSPIDGVNIGHPQSKKRNTEKNPLWQQHHVLLRTSWPKRVDRHIVPYDQALKSISDTQRYAVNEGLSEGQLVAVATAACATLPRTSTKATKANCYNVAISTNDGGLLSRPVGAGSKLFDGSASAFISLVKSLIPKQDIAIPGCVVAILLSSSLSSNHISSSEMKQSVLRFLILVSQHKTSSYHSKNQNDKKYLTANKILSKFYAIPFSMLHDRDTVKESVQLLYLITQRNHATKYRLAILQNLYNKNANQNTPSVSNAHASFPFQILVNLYTKYHPELCSAKFISCLKPSSAQCKSYFQFPDPSWMKNFNRLNSNKDSYIALDDKSSCSEENEENRAETLITSNRYKTYNFSKKTFMQQIRKPSFFIYDCWENCTSISQEHDLTVSNLLASDSIQNILVLSWYTSINANSTSTSKSHTIEELKQDFMLSEAIRIRARLPYILHDEWYHNTNKIKKINLLNNLSSFAKYMDGLLPEIEQFLLDDVLMSWDGDLIFTDILFKNLLPMLSPPKTKFGDFKDSVLSFLGKIYVCGSAKTKYDIVVNFLTKLLLRWVRMTWDALHDNGGTNLLSEKDTTTPCTSISFVKFEFLNQLVEWTDKLLITGMLSESKNTTGDDKQSSGLELVHLSAIEFYDAICGLSAECLSFVAISTPSPALLYRLLLAGQAFSVDAVCGLLMKYKFSLEKWKERRAAQAKNKMFKDEFELIKVPDMYGLERVALFNCFIWDFCSVLWRCSMLPTPQPKNLDSGQEDLARENSILFTDVSTKTLQELHTIGSDFQMSTVLSISKGATFAGFAYAFMQKLKHLQNKRGNLNLGKSELVGKIKVKYLDYLRDKGFTNIYTFLTTFVGSLAEREKRKKRKANEMNY